jgi:release factor glutamine methyltransferase
VNATALARRTVGDALDWAARELAAAGVEGARRDGRILLAQALGTSPDQVFAYPERPLTDSQWADFAVLAARRRAREPVSRIRGRREFWSLEFKISAATLDPRPESETLVEAVLDRIGDRAEDLTILDLGTGSGCLLLALLRELPRARGLGVDIDPAALAVARDNAEHLGLSERAAFRHSDWGRELTGMWPVIVGNPPYIVDSDIDGLDPEVARYDPRAALDGGPDGLDAYRALAPEVFRLLAPGGLAALEIGIGQAQAVETVLSAAGLRSAGRIEDAGGRTRCILAISGDGPSGSRL